MASSIWSYLIIIIWFIDISSSGPCQYPGKHVQSIGPIHQRTSLRPLRDSSSLRPFGTIKLYQDLTNNNTLFRQKRSKQPFGTWNKVKKFGKNIFSPVKNTVKKFVGLPKSQEQIDHEVLRQEIKFDRSKRNFTFWIIFEAIFGFLAGTFWAMINSDSGHNDNTDNSTANSAFIE